MRNFRSEMKTSSISWLVALLYIPLFLSVHACKEQSPLTLKPNYTVGQDTIRLQSEELTATFVNNVAYGANHRAGYNGISELFHNSQDSNIFVPFYAGFNLEHIFDGDSLHQLFEPRKHPMTLYRISANEVALYQSATPISKVESLTKFKVVAPHYIDITFKCLLHDVSFFDHGYAGFFWASYIQHPKDKQIYFEGTEAGNNEERWIAAFSTKHGEKSTHICDGEGGDFYFAPNFNATLASHFSDYRFKKHFYFGRFHNMVLAFLFKSDETIRFSQSPTGGGQGCPAWDFQYLIPKPQEGKIYSFQARMIYKPFGSAKDIELEYDTWASQN